MNVLKSTRYFGVLAVAVALLSSIMPAAAATTPPIVSQATAGATLTGSVHDGTGAAVPNAQVTVTGSTTQSTTTDAGGSFSVSVPAGLYRVSIAKGGYNSVALPDVVAAADSSTPLAVTMTQVSLESLRTIGTVTSTSRGGSINAGPAQSTYVSGQQFADLGAPQINDVLQRVPGLTVQQMGSQQDRSIVVGGVQPYETQVLVDGHPLALGQYGVWVSTYFPSFLIGSAEVQSGPGNTTPFANLAVGGTVNLVTPGYTKQTHLSITQGGDNYGSQSTTFLGTGSIGNLSYVVDLGTLGQNTPLTGTTQCITLPDSGNPGHSIVSNCESADGNFYQRGEVFKLKYDFSPKTSFEAGFVGAWGGYSPQGTAWGSFLGPTTIENCTVSTPVICGKPNTPQVGQTINGYQWYTGSSIYNNQTLWEAQFRTAIGSGTLLVRPYIGQIEPEIIVDNANEQNGYFYGQPGVFAPGLTPGQPVPGGAGYVAPAGTAEASCQGSFSSVANPSGIYTTTNTNQFICFNNPYTTYEQDKLYGMTTSFVQPFGDNGNFLNFTYDFHGQSTFAYINQPSFVSVPFSTDRYSTFSLTGAFGIAPSVTMNFGLYDTLWTVNGVQLANPGVVGSTALTGLNRAISHFDPHVAFVARPDANDSIRLAAGTSTTFPFVGQVSGLATYETPACSLGAPYADGGTLTEKNPNLNPETSIAYDLGGDHRFGNNSVLSVDLQETVVHGVFEQLTSSLASGLPNICLSTPALEGIYFPANVAQLVAKSVNLKYSYTPQSGLGYNIAASAQSSIISGFTAADAPLLPANNSQVCGPGTTVGASTCIPYLQAYGQVTWSHRDDYFVGLGAQFYGKNNAYFQPPFTLVDLVARRNVSKNATLQLSVENLLNTNNFGAYLPIPGAGTPLVTNNVVGNSIQQGSFGTSLVPASPRYVRLDLRLHT
jgi:outer membrane receptor protein involved in Fe transport